MTVTWDAGGPDDFSFSSREATSSFDKQAFKARRITVSEQLRGTYVYLVYGIPVLIFVGVAAGMYWIVNRPRSADFMIAAEGEMKKVSWSSKKEIIGGTKVVIATTFILALLLLAVDLAFGLVFQFIGVLKVSSGT